MTTQRIHSVENFIGLSSDDKPETAMIGSEFWESDTGKTYIVRSKTNGISDWVLKK